MLLGMSYSGTRTANAMVVGACGIFILMTINKRSTIIFAICAVMAFLFLMYAPIYNNLTLLRFRSSFKAEEDASFNVREQNRASIQPYIHQHPFGGGLSTTGQSGREYNPGHPLAGFPPDSGYLNKALETGWVGLGLSCILYFVTLQYAIQGFFRSKNNMIKTLFAASSAFLFSFYLGEMVQEAVGQFTNMVVYYPVVAMVLRLRHLNAPHTYESIS
jgi:cell division protein FtsW (lipid II flippase)